MSFLQRPGAQNVSGGPPNPQPFFFLKPAVLVVLIAADVVYSFIQYYHFPLDGDLARLVLPDPWHKEVFSDPLGLSAFVDKKVYYGPNRYFFVMPFSLYFKNVPLLLQNFLSPIASIYAACAIAKISVHLLQLWAIASFSSAGNRPRNTSFLMAAAITFPLIQADGFVRTIGLIDPSITYTFAYALPISGLFFLLQPFIKKHFHGQPVAIGPVKALLLAVAGVMLVLSGPLVAPVLLIVCPIALLSLWINRFLSTRSGNVLYRSFEAFRQLPAVTTICFVCFCLLGSYSIYIGSFNIENLSATMPLAERYQLLPTGMQWLLKHNGGLVSLLAMAVINLMLVKWKGNEEERKKVFLFLKYFLLLALLYILLLPLGGYRSYRPLIVRYDTFIPVTLGLIGLYTYSSVILLHQLAGRLKLVYGSIVLAFLVFLTLADQPVNFNACEINALKKIAASDSPVVEIENRCTVMEFNRITDPNASFYNAMMLEHWGVLDTIVLYYQAAE